MDVDVNELALRHLKLSFPDFNERMGKFYMDEDGEIRTWESWIRSYIHKDNSNVTLLDMKSLREIDLNPDGPKAA